ncbi:MAG: oligosaccharide flippase family protein, partial [Nitrospirota bacterium]|nr:oligosaccharide flippase family protein [Nitrospirota bacterium]
MYKKSKDHLLNLLRQAMTKDSFVQNSAYMFFSSGSAILIQMAFFPILSRIYSPEAYGLFGVINFYTSAVGSSASLSLNQALVLPRERSEFLSLLRLNFLVTFAIVAFVTLLTLACGHTLMVWANTEQMGNWVYLVGPIGLVIAVNRIMVEWTVREKAFRKVTVWSTANSLFNKLFNVGYGKFIDAGATGLVITNVLLYAGQVAACGAFVIRDTWAALRATVPWHEVVSTARKYKNFPRYMFWANTINLVSANIPSVALPALGFALNYVGYFNFALLLLDLPIRMMGSGISSVFLPKAVEMKEERAHELAPATWKLFRMM